MIRKATFLPSGRSCAIETNESVLEACLRAGLTPVYGCSNGNCGKCKAVLKSGEVEQLRHYDYGFSAAEKAQGAFLMCAHRALTDIAVEADVTQSHDDIPLQTIKTKIKAVEQLDPLVIKLHLQTPRSQRLRFISGQSATLLLEGGTEAVHAIASCPCDDRNLQFHIPDIPGDAFSELVFAGQIGPRDTIEIVGPEKSALQFDESDQRHSLVLCWHTGFAPVISLIEHAMSLEVNKDIHLYRFSPTPAAQYLSNLCRSWVDAYDNFHAEMMPDRVSLLSTVEACQEIFDGLAARHDDIANFNVYVVGPPSFVQAAMITFSSLGLKAAQIRTRVEWADVI